MTLAVPEIRNCRAPFSVRMVPRENSGLRGPYCRGYRQALTWRGQHAVVIDIDETRTNIIPGKNDDPEEHYQIASWIRDNLGADSPWHVTRFFPAYLLSDVPQTPEHMLFEAEAQAKRAGLNRVYVYNDKGCDCATENKPIEVYLDGTAEEIHQVKQCAASCCGSIRCLRANS